MAPLRHLQLTSASSELNADDFCNCPCCLHYTFLPCFPLSLLLQEAVSKPLNRKESPPRAACWNIPSSWSAAFTLGLLPQCTVPITENPEKGAQGLSVPGTQEVPREC